MDTKASDRVLARLSALHPKKIDLSLGRMHRILAKLGNPEKKLPPVIHIAGTNGKGSTIANLRAIAEAAGHRVHVYTSPHLVRFHERIRVANQLIGEEELTSLLERIEQAAGDDPITFFEVTTAAALLAFAETPADLCLLEVGLGGRLDATNVIEAPAAVGITPVSLDHQQFLGETLPEIAAEKAGIIKKGAPLVVGQQKKVGLDVIKDIASLNGVTPLLANDAWHYETMKNGTGILYEDWHGTLNLPTPPLAGVHQTGNAAMAVAIARAQKAVSIPDAAIKAGLGWVRWPARLQEVTSTRFNKILPDGSDLWLDGGHNPAAAETIRTFLQHVDPVERSVTIVLGMMGPKDAAGFLAPLVGLANQVIAVPIPGEDGGAPAATLAAAATDLGINGIIAKDVESAIKTISTSADKSRPPFVLIAGSLYLAGSVLRELELFPV
ncbi:bifunctional folylpolyglutamate synthase/dihydrofolate synthase [Kordiimonas aquimaris]|uniref:bifunctional folylpolyglutamate synthase/dihydrofolate synthase n=1 Tax=Kordiimonas aquimaris TaxID=707591 RepID=UPI0021CE4624|nr:folylpolyglutamate synthase/dihydrofolate synthase family protein [Kordiimonas aquimaris]